MEEMLFIFSEPRIANETADIHVKSLFIHLYKIYNFTLEYQCNFFIYQKLTDLERFPIMNINYPTFVTHWQKGKNKHRKHFEMKYL